VQSRFGRTAVVDAAAALSHHASAPDRSANSPNTICDPSVPESGTIRTQMVKWDDPDAETVEPLAPTMQRATRLEGEWLADC